MRYTKCTDVCLKIRQNDTKMQICVCNFSIVKNEVKRVKELKAKENGEKDKNKKVEISHKILTKFKKEFKKLLNKKLLSSILFVYVFNF